MSPPSPSPHPDAGLFDLCRRLEEMRAEWQRLDDATSEEARLTMPEDHAWNDYSYVVWPGGRISSRIFHAQPHPDDVPDRLLRICAMTPEGQTAQAVAILATAGIGVVNVVITMVASGRCSGC